MATSNQYIKAPVISTIGRDLEAVAYKIPPYGRDDRAVGMTEICWDRPIFVIIFLSRPCNH